MADLDPPRRDLSTTDLAALSEKEALMRLDLITTVSSLLAPILDDYDEAFQSVAEACVAEFADLCAIELAMPDGSVRTAAYHRAPLDNLGGLRAWLPLGARVAPDKRGVLTYAGAGRHPETAAEQARLRLGAQSLIVVQIGGGGNDFGWLVLAVAEGRRGFRPSALPIANDLGGRLGTAMKRVTLHREMQAAAREQGRTVRRLRRLAAAATNLAGAASTQAVLDTACVEACLIHEARGALARWSKADGSVVEGRAGEIDDYEVERALGSVGAGRISRGRNWVAYPLPNTDPWQHAALIVFAQDGLGAEDEPVLSSLASLIPVAFERALGTEMALKHEARLRAVVDASPVALVEVDRKGTAFIANRTALELFPWVSGPERNFDEPVKEQMTELIDEVLDTGSIITRHITVKDRELSVSGARLPPVTAPNVESVLIAGVDLTDMRRAELALVQAQRLDAMGQVAGRVAHDFNNLLTLIVGYAAVLRRDLHEEKHSQMLSNIEGATKRAAELTQQMLDMTRQKIDTGVVIDLSAAVAGLDAVLARVVGPRIELRIRAAHNVIKVRLDPSEMEQIIVNLVINACDAMSGDGQVDVAVQIVAPPRTEVRDLDLPEGPLALLTVGDDGPGMAPEVKARCLEPFFTTKERGRGTGLGLPTVYGLVRERGGQLHIDSEPGHGTRIRIWLPLARDAIVTATSEEQERWPPGRRIKGRVLLVEDEDDLRQMAAAALTSIGLEVTAFHAGEAALEACRSQGVQFDALVTDVILPGMSGVELAGAIRALAPELPAVFMTGYAGSAEIPSDQGDPILRKPYTPDALRLRAAEAVMLGRVRARLR